MLVNHPQRLALADELHARPFPKVTAPVSIAYLAITSEGSTDKDRLVLVKLLKLMGYAGPKPEGSHCFIDLGAFKLKWERHTEFAAYTLFADSDGLGLFQNNPHNLFPKKWLQNTEGQILTSCFLDVLGPFTQTKAESFVTQEFFKHFKVESLAMSYVLGKDAVVASDFMIDTDGHIKLAVLAIGQVGENRLGRIVQRLLEIETYKSLAMLTLPIARDIFAQVGELNLLRVIFPAACGVLWGDERVYTQES